MLVEAAERRENKIFCLGESDLFSLSFDWRVDIGVLELVELEQLRFKQKIFLRQGIVSLDGLHHGLDRFRRDFIREMCWRRDVAVVAHLTIDLVIKKDIV